MESISESKVVYAVVISCVVITEIYFMVKHQAARRGVYSVEWVKEAARLRNIDQSRGHHHGAHTRRNRAGGQCEAGLHGTAVNGRQQASHLPNLDRRLKLVYVTLMALNVYLVLKYFVLCLLDWRKLRDYRYLDCLLIGRASINGRTTGLAKYIGLCLPLFQLSWRFTMLYLRPKFNFDYMEFLLHNPNELIVWEAEMQGRAKPTSCPHRPSAPTFASGQLAEPKMSDFGQSSAQRRASSRKHFDLDYKYASLMNYRNPFVAGARQLGALNESFSRLRPNRSFRAWAWTSQVLLLYLLVTFGLVFVAFVPTIRMYLPLALTRPGFRLNYYNCLDWIARQPNKHHYAFIDTAHPNDSRAALALATAFMPLDELVDFNLYHSVRLVVDVCENLFIFMEALVGIVVYTALTVISVADMYSYTEHINRRAERMIRTLTSNRRPDERTDKSGEHSKRNPSRLVFLAADGIGASSGPFDSSPAFEHTGELELDKQHHAQMLDIQAMVVDMFALINAYNPYAAFFTMYSLTIWFFYSAICSVPWLFLPLLAETSTLEWYLFEAIATLFIFLIIGSLNSVRRSTARLYRSLCTLATLDYTKNSGRNDRWLGLLKLYTPIPLHCFTTFRTSEISWLLGLKMFAWLASALFVTSSFFVNSVYRI